MFSEEKANLRQDKLNDLKDQINIEQTQHILNTTKETFSQNLKFQQTVIKQHLLGETNNAEDSETAIGNVPGKRILNVTSITEDETTNSKKTKVTFDMSFDEYVDVASIITETVRSNDAAAHTNPSWWGILDFREEGVHPSPNLPRAKQFLPEKQIDQLMAMSKRIIGDAKSKIGKSAKLFLDALSRSDIISLNVLAKEKGARGIAGLCSLLKREVKMDDLSQFADSTLYRLSSLEQVELADIDIEDDDTMYIGRCIEDANAWVQCFNGNCKSERTIDMFILGPCARTPRTVFLYGENHSNADREDKTERSNTDRAGKSCDFLYQSCRQEIGIGENAGPNFKDHYDKAKTNFIDVMKVAKSQHIQLKKLLIEKSTNPLPGSLQDSLALITIPFFYVVNLKIRFYLLFQINGDLYGMYEWASENLPIKDTDVGEVILLCKQFLTYKCLVDNAGRAMEVLLKKTKLFRDEIAKECSHPTVQLEQLRTPKK